MLFKILRRLHGAGAFHEVGADAAQSDHIFDAATSCNVLAFMLLFVLLADAPAAGHRITHRPVLDAAHVK